jgi:hypothetical protein
MKKGIYLISLVTIMFFISLAETVSGFVLWFALPSGGGRGGLELTYFGIARHTWINIHDWLAIALVVVVTVHLLIHWKWVVRMIRNIIIQLTDGFRSIKGSSVVTTDSKSE